MNYEMVAAKVTPEALYPDLTNGGFSPGHTFKCHACDITYRLFYRSFGVAPSVARVAADVPSFESSVEDSHPEHPDRIWVRRQL
jgi:hypothetical protein